MAKTFEEKLVESSGEETLKAAKQILKHNALAGAWRSPEGVIHARIQGNTLHYQVAVTPGNPATAVCSCSDRSGKLCEHAVAALLYCGRFNPAAIKPIGETASAYAGLKYENLEELAGRENTEKNAALLISVSSEFPHVPSKWENAVLNVKLRNKEREYLGNVNNLRQLFFDKKLSISLKIDDFSLQEQQIIRFLAINGEPDNSNVLLNSEQTAEFFHCLVGFKNFTRDGRRLLVRADRAEPVILRQQTPDGLKISAGIRVGHALLPISNAKVITGRSGCWIGREGEYYFIPAVVDIGFLRNFFRTGEQFFPGKISENFLDHGRFPLPLLDAKVLELEEAPLAVLLAGKLSAEGRLNVVLRYFYGDEAFAPGSGRLARIGSSFVKRDECAELRLENELEMFGFRREEDSFTLEDSEGIGLFLQELLPLWLRSRSNYALNSELAMLSRGGSGLEALGVRNQVKGLTPDAYLIQFHFGEPAMGISFKRLAAAARKSQNFLVADDGRVVHLSEALRRYMRGLENAIRNLREKESTFELPFFAADYFLYLTERFPEARPPELGEKIAPENAAAATAPEFRFEGTLRTYQQQGVDWLAKMTDNKLNVILADEMGLGKTVQLLALLATRKKRGGNPALVICPASLVTNWEREANKFVPEFKVAALNNGGDRENVWEHTNSYDLVIASYAIARRDAEALKKLRFCYLILDEAQHIKNPGTANAMSCKSISAAHKIVLTGTPLENSPEDLWSIFDFLHSGMLGNFNAFRSTYGDLRDNPELQEDLANRIAPFLKRRTKAEVCAELPPKEERMIFCDMHGEQRSLYETIRETGRKQLADCEKSDKRVNAEIFTTLLRLRQTCCHPALLPDSPAAPSTKFELLQELVLEHIDSGHKLLLFSQFTSFLAKITEWLDRDKIAYEYLDGSTRNRQDRVDNFNNNPEIPIFLLSLKAGGTGLNLTSADTVILCDPWWNPAVELQAADRTHRIGQSRPVTSLKLLVRDSIEEKILALQEKKQQMFDNVIDNPSIAATKFTIEDLKFLLN